MPQRVNPKALEIQHYLKLAEVWAAFDGCEGGDLLRGIAAELERSQDGYGYAMSERTQDHLLAALKSELDEQMKWSSDQFALDIHGQEEIDAVHAETKRILDSEFEDGYYWRY
jgi:hypothetical protein